MALFDRFRSQPKWKHADATVRLTAVEELAVDEQALLATVAREDQDARVRRAAVHKLYDPAVLAEAAERDADGDVREEAAGVLLDLALGAFEDSSEAEGLKALEHLRDPRQVMAVAKRARAEAVSLAALSRLADVKAFGSVARRAVHAATRMKALGCVVDEPDELLAVAMKADHRDVALAALERLQRTEHLQLVAGKSAHKAVVRRARGMLKEREDAARAVEQAAAVAQASARNWGGERDRVLRDLEAAQSASDWRAIESRIAGAQAEWTRLDAESGEGADPMRAASFAAAASTAHDAIARLKRDEANRAERLEQSEREAAARVALCERVDGIRTAAAGLLDSADNEGAASLDQLRQQLADLRTEWAALVTPAVAPADLAGLERRFDRASEAAEREVDRARTARARRSRLAELVVEAEALAGDADPADSRTHWNALKQEWMDLDGPRLAGQSLAERFDAARAAAAAREAEAREQQQQRQREELQRVLRICEQVEAVAKGDTLTLKDGERALRDAKTALDRLAGLSKKDRADVAERLRAAQASLFPRVHELRETDEWVRWANVGIQEELCRRAEALREVPDPAEAAQQLRDLQQQWKKAAAVPRDKAQGLWERFKTAGDEVHARAETHFAEQAAEREQNLARKDALCQQAEALADSTDWVKTAEAIKQLQAQWTAIGPVPRGHEKAIWERFRAACDTFFTRRRDDLNKRKEEWAANQTKKEALISQVEALVDTTDWSRGIEEVKRLQAEWKAVGPVRKSRSEELWGRFRGACDRFFERYQQRDQIQVAANIAAREAICAELEALVAAPAAEDVAAPEAPEGLAETVKALRARWQQAPTLMPRDTTAVLTTRFNDAVAAVARAFPQAFQGSYLDVEAVRRKAEALCERVEKAVPSGPEEQPVGESPASILAARLREALAANTIGGVAVADEEARWRNAVATVRETQAAWAALAPMPSAVEQAFGPRFQQACRRFFEAVDRRKR